MSEFDLEGFGRPERLTVHAQTKLTPGESVELDEFVAWCRTQGIAATRSTVIRGFVRRGLHTARAQMTTDEAEPQ
jgi:hypothetical protein